MLICLLGKSGSGKSYIAKTLCSYSDNIIHINIDQIGHQVLEHDTVHKRLIETFGNHILENNHISRNRLGHIVFNSETMMNKLTDITWQFMEEQIDEIIKNNPHKVIILDWLLLIKTKYFKMADLRVLVDASYEVRLKRAMDRDGISEAKFFERDSVAPILDLKDFDIVINNIDINKTNEEVYKIYEKSIVSR